MAIILNTDVETAKKYRNKTLVAKINNKRHQIIFKIDIDEFSFDDAVTEFKENKNVAMLDYHGAISYLSSVSSVDENVYIGMFVEVGNTISEDYIQKLLDNYPEWLNIICKLPEDYKNIYFIRDMCAKYPRIRFAGGTLFDLEGIRVGGIGFDTVRNMGVKVNKDELLQVNCTDVLPTEYSLEDLDIKVNVGKTLNSIKKGSTEKKSSEPKAPKKVAKFGSFLDSLGGVDF